MGIWHMAMSATERQTLMRPDTAYEDSLVAARRRRARRTAWIIAGIALTIYVGFILSGVLGK